FWLIISFHFSIDITPLDFSPLALYQLYRCFSMFHMKQFRWLKDNFFVRSVKKKVICFFLMKNKFHYTPANIPKLKQEFQPGKEEGTSGYEAFLAREKRSEVDSF
ncbi:MAG: hypothetical protein ACI4O0_05290, partial [Candidatus Limivicinus sp.]